MLLKMALFHSFLWLSNIPLCILPYLLYFFICQWTFRLFTFIAIVNSAAMSIGVHVSFGIRVLSGYMPRIGITGSCGNSSLTFWENSHTIFHSDCTKLHSHQHYSRVPFSLYLFQHLLFEEFLIMLILTGMRWYLIIGLICIANTGPSSQGYGFSSSHVWMWELD